MLKAISLFLLITVFVSGTIHSQTLSRSSTENQVSLNEAISKDTEKHQSEAVAVSEKEMQKPQTVPQSGGWSTKKKILVTAAVVVLVGLFAVVLYNSARCIKREPAGCDFNDTYRDCRCVEYDK